MENDPGRGRLLQAFQRSGCPKHKIALTISGGINIVATDIEVLRKTFGLVEWDGLEKGDDSHEEHDQWYIPEEDVDERRIAEAEERDYEADDEEDELSEDDGDE
ncbi:hypothetical protein GLOTRDRAFT_134555 [Gloeophyllum trabeum ATCC 11539]|uniref:Uncharacterized protein n=1 Tax=Gloeophyllum trabeum (strain ATCC 11539 / FP-39264 / Madison 617) TaxID=670483 RepID=S7RBR2_GLOTA|nr:uncharacterized protein GLOTRDRAFT_134555 [Gloeophyllum trabeum ATCC 11539]EPQ49834.1 hypothetical protein GLOTRDRAFT_134555 [Gloeophyllum trabeum ATCC 11539]